MNTSPGGTMGYTRVYARRPHPSSGQIAERRGHGTFLETAMDALPAKNPVKIKVPPVLFEQTQKLVKEVEKETGAPFLCYWTSTSGAICQNDAYALYELLKRVGKVKELGIFVKSDGGDGCASLRIVNTLRRHTDRLIAYVPLECASAATMLVLGADTIYMGPMAYLTAVDTSLEHDLSPVDRNNDLVSVSQDELRRVVNLWNQQSRNSRKDPPNPYAVLFGHVHPLVIGAVDRASSLSVMLSTEILSFHLRDRDKARRIASHLNSAYPSHRYPIIPKEARRIGLPAREMPARVNEMLLNLNGLYSEMGQRARTDYDEQHQHSNEILNIIERRDLQIYWQNDKDWHYRAEERRWITLNDNSSWRRIERTGKKTVRSVIHIR